MCGILIRHSHITTMIFVCDQILGGEAWLEQVLHDLDLRSMEWSLVLGGRHAAVSAVSFSRTTTILKLLASIAT